MKKILLTAFEPFDGKNKNASSEIMNCLEFDLHLFDIHKLILPTTFNDIESLMINKISSFKPDIILMLGEASGTNHIRIERVAINIDDARIPDNTHYQPIDQIIKQNSDNALFSTLPIKKIHHNLLENEIPAVISNSAGTFVCNHLFYITLYDLQQKKASNTIAGFIHFPLIKSQIKSEKQLYLPLTTSIEALKTIILSCL